VSFVGTRGPAALERVNERTGLFDIWTSPRATTALLVILICRQTTSIKLANLRYCLIHPTVDAITRNDTGKSIGMKLLQG
jgi:hypothetical protein